MPLVGRHRACGAFAGTMVAVWRSRVRSTRARCANMRGRSAPTASRWKRAGSSSCIPTGSRRPICGPRSPSGPDEAPLWELFESGDLVRLHKAIAARQAAEPDWQPSDDLLDKIKTSELRAAIFAGAAARQMGRRRTARRRQRPRRRDVGHRAVVGRRRGVRAHRARDRGRRTLRVCPQEPDRCQRAHGDDPEGAGATVDGRCREAHRHGPGRARRQKRVRRHPRRHRPRAHRRVPAQRPGKERRRGRPRGGGSGRAPITPMPDSRGCLPGMPTGSAGSTRRSTGSSCRSTAKATP